MFRPAQALTVPAVDAASRRTALRLALCLAPFAILGVALVRLYPDSYQQDGGFHYLFARWSFEHPRFLVDVWGRPLFTALYALPARLGYPAAKLLTVAVALAAAWHTAGLAADEGLERPELAIPLLFLQPSFLLLCSETMTEPLFALVLVIALRLHRAGRVGAGMRVASLLPLARPEGFFVAGLWGLFVLFDRRAGRGPVRRALSTLQLGGGVALWWLAALAITRSPLFILHNWPSNWAAGFSYGTGPLDQYWLVRGQLLAGRAMLLLFGLGVVALVATRRAGLGLSALTLVLGLHTVFFHYGLFGSAGYARYLVCVAPVMALAALAGWNLVAAALRKVPRPVTWPLGAAVLLWSAVLCLRYVDGMGSSRDALAVEDMIAWLREHPRPVTRLVFSQAYMPIALGRDGAERPRMPADAASNVELLKGLQPGTLVFWDAQTGPRYHGLGPADLERAGYELLHTRSYALSARFPWAHESPPPPRQQQYWLYWKPTGP